MTSANRSSRAPRRRRAWSTGFPRFARAAAIAALLVACAGCTSLVNRVAFLPNREYAIAEADLPASVRRVAVPTADGERLESFVVGQSDAERLVIYFPGNSGNISQLVPQLQRFAMLTGAAVLGINYRGYGASSGQPSERGIYRDGAAALRYAKDELGCADQDIVLCGFSLGTAVAMHVAMDRTLAGVILVAPMTSARELARDHGRGSAALLVGGAFNSLAKARRLRAPVLIIHGTDDEIIPYREGRRLFGAIPTAREFVTIDGAHHADVWFRDAQTVWSAITEFVTAPRE